MWDGDRVFILDFPEWKKGNYMEIVHALGEQNTFNTHVSQSYENRFQIAFRISISLAVKGDTVE